MSWFDSAIANCNNKRKIWMTASPATPKKQLDLQYPISAYISVVKYNL